MKIFIFLFTLLAITNVYAQENPNETFPLEFSWQKDIANKSNKNIKDYFLLIPSTFINCEGAERGAYSTIDKREKKIKKIDLKNGYLQFNKKAQLVLYKDRKNNVDIVAIQSGGCGAANTCGALNTLIEFKNNVWKFRIDLLPQGKMMEDLYYTDAVCPYFDLPQFGTTILIKDENNENSIVAKYEWTKERFIISQ